MVGKPSNNSLSTPADQPQILVYLSGIVHIELSELLTGRENTICVSSLNVRKVGKAPNDKVTWIVT